MHYTLKTPALTKLSLCWSLSLYSWNYLPHADFHRFLRALLSYVKSRKAIYSLCYWKMTAGEPHVEHPNRKQAKSVISFQKNLIKCVSLYSSVKDIHYLAQRHYKTSCYKYILPYIYIYRCTIYTIDIYFTYRCGFCVCLCVFMCMLWNTQPKLPNWIQSAAGQPNIP